MLPHFEGRVIDEEGNLVPLGTPGEYCSRGPGVMLGYWNQPEATAAAIRDGWMHTGDLATMDAEGSHRGRIKDMIIRGGENMYPARSRPSSYHAPGDRRRAVFGIPMRGSARGLRPGLAAEPGCSVTEEEMRAFCAGASPISRSPTHRFVTNSPRPSLARSRNSACGNR